MNTRRRSLLSYIPGYTNNAVLQLIIFSGVAYVVLSLMWGIIFLLYQGHDDAFRQYFIPCLALPQVSEFGHHWWTLLTYGWFQYPNSFFELLSNMLWLYCFGSVVQTLVGHRQVIPIYAYCLLTGGICYLLGQLLPGEWGKAPFIIGLLGPRAALMGMAIASVTLTPRYRFYLTETFSIPLALVVGIFAFLMITNSGFYLPVILLLVAGGCTGYGYIILLKSGYRPGEWMYRLTGGIASAVTPNEYALQKKRSGKNGNTSNRNSLTQERIDALLDKINQKGYNSLTSEEKELLKRAGKE